MEIKFVEFNPKEASEKDWQRYHTYRKKRHQEVRPDEELLPDEIVEKSFKADNPMVRNIRYVLVDQGKQIGTINASVLKEGTESYENNKHIIQGSASLLPEYRNRGLGYQQLAKIYENAKTEDKSMLVLSTAEEDGKRFFDKIGAKTALTGAENQLDLTSADWEMIQSWVKAGKENNQSTDLNIFEVIPEEIIEAYCRLWSEVNNQQPLDDLDVNDMVMTPDQFRQREAQLSDMDVISLTMVTQEENGEFSGLTEILIVPGQKTVRQGLTGVQQKHRGRGLGKWLKAAMLLHVKNNYPDTNKVSTENADTNAPMRSINDRLGFVKHKATVNAQMKVEDIGKLLSEKGMLITSKDVITRN